MPAVQRKCFDAGMNYVCEKQARAGEDLLVPAVAKSFAADDRASADPKLLATGKTVAEGFVSKRQIPAVRGVPDCEGRQDGVRVRCRAEEGQGRW